MTSLLRRADLVATGRTDADLRRQVRNAELVRLRPGFYRDPSELRVTHEHLLRIRAYAELSPMNGTAFSHHSAALLLGVPLPSDILGPVTLLQDGVHGGYQHPQVHLRRRPDASRSFESMRGLPVTSLEQTVVDLARSLDRGSAVAVVDHGLRRGVQRAALLDLIRGTRCPVNAQARWAIEFGDGNSESWYESLTRVCMLDQGIPTPELQFWVLDANGMRIGRTDWVWRGLRMLGEFDGKMKYGRELVPGQSVEDALIAELQRELRMMRQGWSFVRWIAREVHAPGGVRTVWNESLAARDAIRAC